MTEDIEYIQFHSRSAIDKSRRFPYDDAMRRLSNFSGHSVIYKEKRFPTVEHAFQYAKYECIKPQLLMPVDINSIKETFYTGSAQEAKTRGGKTAMKRYGVELDIDKWNECKDAIMTELVHSKIEMYEDIRSILQTAKEKNFRFLHFARNDFEWGGHLLPNKKEIKGENKLGKIYNDWITK